MSGQWTLMSVAKRATLKSGSVTSETIFGYIVDNDDDDVIPGTMNGACR
jgi:hypothetical protein